MKNLSRPVVALRFILMISLAALFTVAGSAMAQTCTYGQPCNPSSINSIYYYYLLSGSYSPEVNLQYAINEAVGQGGGEVIIPPGTNISLTSFLDVGGCAVLPSPITNPCTVGSIAPVKLTMTGAILTVTSSVTGAAIYLYAGSGIVGSSGLSNIGSYIDYSNASSGLNVVVQSYPENGTSQGVYL